MNAVAWCMFWLAACGCSPAFAGQTVTTYTYNKDGALTAMEVTEQGGQTTTTYLTWDNFVPDENDPGTGVLSLGDGSLVARGDAPGGEASFVYDARARLTSQGQNTQLQLYDYHPDSILSQTTLQGDTRRFYHARGAFPEAVSISETVGRKERLSARLGPGRYLSDGTQQSLLTPRKDVSGVVNESGDAFTGKAYGPFGVPLSPPAEVSRYDLTEPPDGFAGEYTDPAWGGVYMRARWYDPGNAQFISRDPRPNLNRFAYGGGNPVANIDPGGMNFFRSAGSFLGKAFDGHGIAGDFASLFLMPIVGPMEIAANPRGFWQGIVHNRGNMDVFLALGIATEAFSIGFEEYGWSTTVRNWDPVTRIRVRRGIDLGLGISQAVSAGYSRGGHHFSGASFGASLTQSFGTLLWSHYVAGVGYHPYAQNSEDITNIYNYLRDNNNDQAYVFRESDPIGASVHKRYGNVVAPTTPLAEKLNLGFYHEAVVVVSKHGIYWNELVNREVDGVAVGQLRITQANHPDDVDTALLLRGTGARYQHVGYMKDFRASDIVVNPSHLYVEGTKLSARTFRYSTFRNNCQTYASAVLTKLLN